MQAIAIDQPPPRNTNITIMFPDMFGFVGTTFSLPGFRSVLLIKFGHHSNKPVFGNNENCRSIDFEQYPLSHSKVICGNVKALTPTSEVFLTF